MCESTFTQLHRALYDKYCIVKMYKDHGTHENILGALKLWNYVEYSYGEF